jgi:hypothetical protein
MDQALSPLAPSALANLDGELTGATFNVNDGQLLLTLSLPQGASEVLTLARKQ